MGAVVQECKRLVLAVLEQFDPLDLAILGKEFVEILFSHFLFESLDLQVGEGRLVVLNAFCPWDERLYIHDLAGQLHPIHFFNGLFGSIPRLKVHKPIALGFGSFLVHLHLARENVAKLGEGIVQRRVVNGLVQVFDDDVSFALLSDVGVLLAPHDADGFSMDRMVVEGLTCPLSIGCLNKIDISIAQGHPTHCIPANPDGKDGPHLFEDIV
mmetsp:Transcript_42397/g.76000  ORF Transcript_42397/g.76000 Transcript_42397/m.76000 type:complete len:212 (-) Transcript_42397:116-751(-)